MASLIRTYTVAVLGNPNTGKSTLFSALTGVHSRIGNYPGVTVEKKIGWFDHRGVHVQLIDLPGTYSLSPRTTDEMVSVDVLLGRQADVGAIDAVVCIADASNLERNLYVVSQVLDTGLPAVLVLNMWDVAESRGIEIDVASLSARLGIPVVTCEAHRRKNIESIKDAILSLNGGRALLPFSSVSDHPRDGQEWPSSNAATCRDTLRLFPPAFYAEVDRLRGHFHEGAPPDYLLERLLLDPGGHVEAMFTQRNANGLAASLAAARERLRESGLRIPAVEAKVRYAWARQVLDGVVKTPPTRTATLTDRIDHWLTHRVWGLVVFCVLMFTIFQAIYSGAKPVMDGMEAAENWLGSQIAAVLAPGPFRSLLIDGAISGVGSVLAFLPQIALLFLFIALLEDCGYMARAAFLMDKLMTKVGLSGKSFVPLMSSFACAVPGIMATRVIENRRDRMVTILVAPLMSCSARLPVYVLLIGAFVPATWIGGWIPLQGTVLFAMTALGAVVAVPIAWLLKKTLFRGETPPFVMELPTYKWPSPRIVLHRVYDRAKAFVLRAGTLIFATNVLVWALAYFPGDHRPADQLASLIDSLPKGAPERDDLVAEHNRASERLLESSILGRLGRGLEPAITPLGWDWRIGIGVLASFPAREVIVSTLGTIYSLGGDVDENNSELSDALRSATWPDGRPVYTVPVALSIMVFFALCAQCASTLMVIRRETNHAGWAAFTFTYMTALAYVAALATYQLGTWIAA